jgi:hypothetical protein
MSTANVVYQRSGAVLTEVTPSDAGLELNLDIAAPHAGAAGLVARSLLLDPDGERRFCSQLEQSLSRPGRVTYIFVLLKDGDRKLVVVEFCQGVEFSQIADSTAAYSSSLPIVTRILDGMKQLESSGSMRLLAEASACPQMALEDFGVTSADAPHAGSAYGAALVTPTHVHTLDIEGSDSPLFCQDMVHLHEALSRKGVSRVVRAAAGDRPLKLWLHSDAPDPKDIPPPPKRAQYEPPPAAEPAAEPTIQPNPDPFSPANVFGAISGLRESVPPAVPAPEPEPPPIATLAQAIHLAAEPEPEAFSPVAPLRVVKVRSADSAPPAPVQEESARPVPVKHQDPPATLAIHVEPPPIEPPPVEPERPRVVLWAAVGAAVLIGVVSLLVVYSRGSARPPAPQAVQAPASSPAPPPQAAPAPIPAAAQASPEPAPADAKPAATAAKEPAPKQEDTPVRTAPAPSTIQPPVQSAEVQEAKPLPPPPAAKPADSAMPPPPNKAEDEAAARKKAAIKALTGQQ